MKMAGKCRLIFALACSVLGTVVSAGAQPSGEILIAEGTRISIQLNDHLSTKHNNEGDTFTAAVIVPVYQGDRLVIPKGSVITGSISRVLRPGRFHSKAVINLLFQSIRLPGRGELPIVASLSSVGSEGNVVIHPEGTIGGDESKGKDAARILKPGIAGAGIGALAGGGKGAAVGAGVGAAVGLATVIASREKDLEVRRGTTMDILLNRPLAIPPDAEVSGARNR